MAPQSAGTPVGAPEAGTAGERSARRPPRVGWPSSLVGRSSDLTRVVDAVRAHRLVSVVGTGGVGKTRLAREVVSTVRSEYPHGTCVVDLTTVRADHAVVTAVFEALGLVPTPTETAVQQLRRFVTDRSMLVLLDNCEHVVGGCRSLVVDLLSAGTGLHVLTTSREQLVIAGERVTTLAPLAFPAVSDDVGPEAAASFAAVRLLAERAAAVSDGFVVDAGNVGALVDICRQLDGLPLAIELAAVRLRSLTPNELRDRLADRFVILNRGDPTARGVHRTLHATVGWSWDLCTPAEQAMWARMSVFLGGADLAAVRAVYVDGRDDAASEVEVLDVLDTLIGRSVVLATTDGDRTRYRMLETIAAFGRERLRESGSESAAADAHARWFHDLAVRGATSFMSPDQLTWHRRLSADRANLTAAADHLAEADDDGRAALELTYALRFQFMTGALSDGPRLVRRALERYRADDTLRIDTLLGASTVLMTFGDVAGSVHQTIEAAGTADRLGDPTWIRRCAPYVILAQQFGGDFVPGRLEAAIAALQAPESAESLMRLHLGHAYVLLSGGAVDAAQPSLGALRGESEGCGEIWMRSHADSVSGMGHWLSGDLDRAVDMARRSFEVNLLFDDRRGLMITLDVLVGVAGARRDMRRAALLLGAAGRAMREVGILRSTYGPSVDAALAQVESDARQALGDGGYADAFDQGGAIASFDELHRIAFQTSGPRPAVTGGDHPNPLSAREFEVASLLPSGMTNRQIAEHLTISVRTVDGHLERILAKLEVGSRAEIAVWVVSQSRSV